MSKDYYAVLGVLPTAEDVVIKAAYRALAQNYHPDRYSGDPESAHQRMVEINEAYAVLSDPSARGKYDKTREQANKTNFSDDTSCVDESEDLERALRSDWEVACNYFPDLLEIFEGLKKTAIRLAVTFEAFILATKQFDARFDIASKLEQLFLEKYFGNSPAIITFAKQLVKESNKPALQELNNAVRVLGTGVDPSVVIDNIFKKHCYVTRKAPASFGEAQIRFAQNYWLEFRRAVIDGNLEVVKSMLGSDPALIVISNTDKNTALHLSIIENKFNVFCHLLDVGTDPKAENASGNTATTMCKLAGREQYREELLIRGHFG